MSKRQPRVTILQPTLDELLRLMDEMLKTFAAIRYSEWSKVTGDHNVVDTTLHGVDLQAATLDDYLQDGDLLIKRVKQQAQEHRRERGPDAQVPDPAGPEAV